MSNLSNHKMSRSRNGKGPTTYVEVGLKESPNGDIRLFRKEFQLTFSAERPPKNYQRYHRCFAELIAKANGPRAGAGHKAALTKAAKKERQRIAGFKAAAVRRARAAV
jgi:hypothetical protein